MPLQGACPADDRVKNSGNVSLTELYFTLTGRLIYHEMPGGTAKTAQCAGYLTLEERSDNRPIQVLAVSTEISKFPESFGGTVFRIKPENHHLPATGGIV